LVGTLSPDGLWYWDGTAWQSALSSDGLWRWDGTAWLPTSRSSGRRYASATAPGPPSRAYRQTVIVALVAATAFVAIAGGVAIQRWVITVIPDWQSLAVLSGVVLVSLLVVAGFLARPKDWHKGFAGQSGSWRLSIVTAVLAFGACAVIAFLLLILGGILTVPDFLAGSGRGSGRAFLFCLALRAAPVVILVLLSTSQSWRWLLARRVHMRSAAYWILLAAMLLSLPVLEVIGSARGGGQLAVVMGGLLAPSVVGFIGILVGREWGRVTATTACMCWSLTGIGLVFSILLLRPKPRIDWPA
jgi:hypothetical protein